MGEYVKGNIIHSLDELMQQEFIYHRHKVIHHGWFAGWKIGYAAYQINIGVIRYAIRNSVLQQNNESTF